VREIHERGKVKVVMYVPLHPSHACASDIVRVGSIGAYSRSILATLFCLWDGNQTCERLD
jgi:hypothetical protein